MHSNTCMSLIKQRENLNREKGQLIFQKKTDYRW